MQKIRLKKQKKAIDRRLLVLTLVLTSLGLVAVADASAPAALSNFSDKFYFVKQQAIWGLIGVVLLLVFSQVNYKHWERVATPFFLASLILLIIVLIPGFGTKSLGARRWIFVGSQSFQPSEIVKLSLAIYFAKVAAKEKKLMSYFLPLGVVALLIMLQPDLGTMVVIAFIGLSQIFVSGVGLFKFFAAVGVGGLVSFVLIITSEYRRARLLTFFQSTQDPLGKSYHIRQILFALGAGGMFGVGLGQSRQKYLFLPEAATDSIFAVIAEEIGFVGSSMLIIVFAAYIFQGMKIAMNAPDKFSRTLSIGLVAWIGGQTFINLAAMVSLVPLTGIPLPFFSYGGSSLVSVLVATGILLNISKYESRQKKKRR